MVAETRGNPQGPRFLTQRNLEKLVLDANGTPVPRPPIDEGFMQLFSYYKPGLTAGNYAITAEQFITATDRRFDHGQQTLRVCNRKGSATLPDQKAPEPQIFEVMTPQFSLDPKLVNSFYPPEGHQDEGRILPHIVIEDPFFPWERDAGHSFDGSRTSPLDKARERDPDLNKAGKTIDKDGTITDDREEMVYRSIVPWVRLLVFDPEELKLSSKEEAKSLGIPEYKDLSKAPDISHQPANGAFSMTAGDYLAVDGNHRIRFNEAYLPDDQEGLDEISTGRRSKEATQVIYPTKDKFHQLCSDLEANKYLAHVRNINTVGCPNAGVEEDGLYSIVISGRTGVLDAPRPTTQICHLISIEHADKSLELDFQDWDNKTDLVKNERIGLISLFSWTYTALPPFPVNFVDSMKAIVGDETRRIKGNMQMLRPPDSLIDILSGSKDGEKPTDLAARTALAERFKKGYVLSRWRSETGEITAAFNRGPLVPLQTPTVPNGNQNWPTGSTTSKNFQIFDKTTGLMDLSYSAAWQLGKILSISDTSFSNALLRFRSFIQRLSASKARSQVNGVLPKANVITGVAAGVGTIRSLANGMVSPPRRVIIPAVRSVATALGDPAIASAMNSTVHDEVRKASLAGDEIYNEFNKIGENNTDWSTILKWITDKLYLADIPAHVLFPDPSFIPEESLRFFYIDDAWMDCLIDGALSAGNHLEKDDDRVKTAIKHWYNIYLSTTIPNTGIKPQIPCYGFILRSQIVKVMPDLKITVKWNDPPGTTDKRAPVCQWLRPDDHTLICLLDRLPEELHGSVPDQDDQSGIVLSQPPHQQRFSFGHAYDSKAKSFEFRLRHLYTKDARSTEWPELKADPPTAEDPRNMASAGCINLTTRVVKVRDLAQKVNQALQQAPGDDPAHPLEAYIDYVSNSAELALELNDPAYYFGIYPEHTSTNTVPRLRQLWAPTVTPSEDSTTPTIPDTLSANMGTEIPKQPPHPDSGDPHVHVPADTPDRPARIVFIDSPSVPQNPPAGSFNQAPPKCFDLRVFVDYKGLQEPSDDDGFSPEDYVPTGNEYLIDLIFSIQKLPDRTDGNNFGLREILINIPHNPRDVTNDKSDALLRKDWDGGARMLSNQRFWPKLSRNDDFLQVRLIPRSAEEHPQIEMNNFKTREVSFRLSDVDVPETKVRNFVSIKGQDEREELGFVRVDMYERYTVDGEGVFSVWNHGSFVIKRDIGDPGH